MPFGQAAKTGHSHAPGIPLQHFVQMSKWVWGGLGQPPWEGSGHRRRPKRPKDREAVVKKASLWGESAKTGHLHAPGTQLRHFVQMSKLVWEGLGRSPWEGSGYSRVPKTTKNPTFLHVLGFSDEKSRKVHFCAQKHTFHTKSHFSGLDAQNRRSRESCPDTSKTNTF